MLVFPTDKSIVVNGKTYNYTVPEKSLGRIEVEKQVATTKEPALVYSEFIYDSDVAHAIAAAEGRRVETRIDQVTKAPWAYKVV